MPSRFPGVDPYLEARWHIVHTKLIVAITEELNRQLPPDLRAEVEQGLRVESSEPTYVRPIYPDVQINGPARSGETASTATLEPPAATSVTVEYSFDAPPQRFVEIRETGSPHRLVTVIELLSLANKNASDGRAQYSQKLHEYLAAGVNVVEYDLLRSGRLPIDLSSDVRKRYHAQYAVTVYRAVRSGQAQVYPLNLRQPIPVIRLPLRPNDAEIALNVQPLYNHVCDAGRYSIDYAKPCEPPLTADDASWAKQIG
jgi:hypothetical protein